jgi:hypothetical protein
MNTLTMNTMTTKLIAAGVLSIFTLLSGVWLSHSGKPYNTAIFTIHKLIAVATVVVIGMNVVNLYKSLDIRTFVVFFGIAISALFFLSLAITGGLLSLDILPQVALRIHQVVPLLAVAASAMTLYILLNRQG